MKRYFFFLLLFINYNSLMATHMMGGEITWTCLSNGKYVFHMKLYRDCNGTVGPTTATISTDAPGFPTGINLNRISQTDISPACGSAGPHITCAGATGTTPGAVEEFIYQSDSVILFGIPPTAGWNFWWGLCCRNNAIVNLPAPGGVSLTLHAKMYQNSGRNAYPCYDSSPNFFEKPHLIVCAGYPYILNTNATDEDFDSLDYNWDYPLNDNTGTTTFNAPHILYSAPYFFNNPLPGNPILDRQTGEINFASDSSGTFVYVVKATAYRCGQKIAEVFRDIQITNTICNEIQPGIPNSPPVITPPFQNSSGLQILFSDTVHAGDTVRFDLIARDLDSNASGVFQHIHLIPTGVEFDSTYTNSPGVCPFPPCATLSPSPIGYSPQMYDTTTFNWITSCSQLQQNNCAFVQSALFTFNFSFYDDFCPIPGLSSGLVKILVVGDSVPSVISSVSNDTLYSSVQSSYYQWYRNDTLLIGANLNYFIPVIEGNYQVEILRLHGCNTKSQHFYYTFASVGFLDNQLSLDITPNPFNHIIHIRASEKKMKTINLALSDVVGKIISTWKFISPDSVFEKEFDLSEISAGVYFLQIKSGELQKSFKLIKYD